MFVAFVLARKIDKHGENTSHKSRTQQQIHTQAHSHTQTHTHSHVQSGVNIWHLRLHPLWHRARLESPLCCAASLVLGPWSRHVSLFQFQFQFCVSVFVRLRFASFFFHSFFLVCKIRVCNLMFLRLISFSCVFRGVWVVGWFGSARQGGVVLNARILLKLCSQRPGQKGRLLAGNALAECL